MHSTIKFTTDWSKISINFFDVTVSVAECIIDTDLYVKYMLNLLTVANIFCRLPVILFIVGYILYSQALPLDGIHLVAVRGLTTKRYSSQERQWEELVGAALLRPIRTNRSSLTCRCQFPDLREKKLD